MKTVILDVDKNPEAINRAADLLKAGELVSFPTETVYGLGAIIWNDNQISKIYEVKNRPADNPLIAHISSLSQLEELVIDIPSDARVLMNKFWPGPLTLLFKKRSHIPQIVTAGLDTICVRMPANQKALDLITSVGEPLVAPSANLSGKPSPTNLSHVMADLNGKISAIIDGGDTEFGIESTVLNTLVNPPQILRPGKITKQDLSEVLGKDVEYVVNTDTVNSPGMKYRHYAPTAKVVLSRDWNDINNILDKKFFSFDKAYLLANVDMPKKLSNVTARRFDATNIYSHFRSADLLGSELVIVFIDEVTEKDEGLMNRLSKAAHSSSRV